MSDDTALVISAKPPRKVFTAKKINKIPDSLLQDEKLQQLISLLPSNYNFEIPKTIWRIQEIKAKAVALQMPEGLSMFATTISEIIRSYTDANVIIMGNVTYGACCVDDLTAKSLEVDLLVHYGHSCLVPMNMSSELKVLYVFVDIKIDYLHFIETLKVNFQSDTKLGLVSTVQFVATLHSVATELRGLNYTVRVPQFRPLSPGEILGCTAPVIEDTDVVIYLGDGRFHLEAAMIANPRLRAYKYDPYSKKFTQEYYDHKVMLETRRKFIDEARSARTFGIIMGTLGRQGSRKVVDDIHRRLKEKHKRAVVILLSEIFPAKLELFDDIDAFVQIACPRLSIDWGKSFSKPLLTPYELAVVLKDAEWIADKDDSSYPMDFYASESLGSWTPNYKPKKPNLTKKECCGKC